MCPYYADNKCSLFRYMTTWDLWKKNEDDSGIADRRCLSDEYEDCELYCLVRSLSME